jgi:hypothetical protein
MKDIFIREIITSHIENGNTIILKCSCLNEDTFEINEYNISIDTYTFLQWFDNKLINEIKNKLIETIKNK